MGCSNGAVKGLVTQQIMLDQALASATVSPCARSLEELVREGRSQERCRDPMQGLEGRSKALGLEPKGRGKPLKDSE